MHCAAAAGGRCAHLPDGPVGQLLRVPRDGHRGALAVGAHVPRAPHGRGARVRRARRARATRAARPARHAAQRALALRQGA